MTVAELGTGGPLDGGSQANREGDPWGKPTAIFALEYDGYPDVARASLETLDSGRLRHIQTACRSLEAAAGVIVASRAADGIREVMAGNRSVNVQDSTDSMGVTAGNGDGEDS